MDLSRIVLSGLRNEELSFRESDCPRSGDPGNSENLSILYTVDPARRTRMSQGLLAGRARRLETALLNITANTRM